MASSLSNGRRKKKVIASKTERPVELEQALLAEVAWEVCNQVGGIYTVIRSKLPAMEHYWGENYFLIGPYVHPEVHVEFAPTDDYSGPVGQAVQAMRLLGYEVHYGHWLVSGHPKVVLFNPHSIYQNLNSIKEKLWQEHFLPTPWNDPLIDQVVTFGEMVRVFITELSKTKQGGQKLITHIHEWMAGTGIPGLRKAKIDTKIVFTTHATMLGRYLAMNKNLFYRNLKNFNWEAEASHYNIESQVKLERAAAHGAHIFTTVSDITAMECEHLIGRKPDCILPNGLNIKKFEIEHELQTMHKECRDKIHQFTMSHFFPSYSFDLGKTLYFFTSGRYEYRNKGFDMTVEALARLNHKMKQAGIDKTVVMFFITKRPAKSINTKILHSRAVLEKIHSTCDAIQKEVGEQLFYQAAINPDAPIPDLNDFISETLRMQLRRTLNSWKSKDLPAICTHDLYDPERDELLNFIRQCQLNNKQDDKVKIVYHADFLSIISPINQQEYDQFVRGCHLGIFPSYYEPWGYTPLECIARGIPSVTSDLSGFGDYAQKQMDQKGPDRGIYVIDRKNQGFEQSAEQLANTLFDFVKMDRRSRIKQRNRTENASVQFDWSELLVHYQQAWVKA